MTKALKFLLITSLVISLFSLNAESKESYYYIQITSQQDKKKIENIFKIIKEKQTTYLLKIGKFYTIRIGPFKSKEEATIEKKRIEKRYHYLKIKPILIKTPKKFPSSKYIVNSFSPQKHIIEKKENFKTIERQVKRENFLLYLKKAKVCFSKKDCSNAIKYLTLAIQEKPKDPLLYTYLGYAYLHLRDYEKAFKAFKKALQINPKFAEGYAGIGYLYLKLDAPNAALIAFRKAHQLKPDEISYFINYGICLIETGKYKEAAKVLSILKERFPFVPEVYYNSALVEVKLKNYLQAQEDLKIFIDMTKGNSFYKEYSEKAKLLLKMITSRLLKQ